MFELRKYVMGRRKGRVGLGRKFHIRIVQENNEFCPKCSIYQPQTNELHGKHDSSEQVPLFCLSLCDNDRLMKLQ